MIKMSGTKSTSAEEGHSAMKEIKINYDGKGRYTVTLEAHDNSGEYFYNLECVGFGVSEEEAMANMRRAEDGVIGNLP
jgi:hypothetical protein